MVVVKLVGDVGECKYVLVTDIVLKMLLEETKSNTSCYLLNKALYAIIHLIEYKPRPEDALESLVTAYPTIPHWRWRCAAENSL